MVCEGQEHLILFFLFILFLSGVTVASEKEISLIPLDSGKERRRDGWRKVHFPGWRAEVQEQGLSLPSIHSLP